MSTTPRVRFQFVALVAVFAFVIVALALGAETAAKKFPAGDAAQGAYTYDDFESDDACIVCHQDIAIQMQQSLMSQCFTHPWDEIEYSELALPHARKLGKVAGIEAGCNGCHAPLAFLAGDIPPKRPAENTRANEAISCDTCHNMIGFEGDVPYNFNYIVRPGGPKVGARAGGESDYHEIEVNAFLSSAEFCGPCHNEKDPYGMWVKATHLEWKDGPHAKAGITCQDCHMPAGPGNAAPDLGGRDVENLRHHLFHGAHDAAKLAGSVEVRVHPREASLKPGSTQTLVANVVNAKAGHAIPSGSVEERVVWLHVEAKDAAGKTHALPVDAKGFAGEEMTIASATALAYQDIGEIRGIADFKGLLRDAGVPAGDRIFRMPYLDPQGRMTVAQWHTASFGPDYRLFPLRTVTETFTWKLPEGLPAGPVTVTATVWYNKLVPSVAEFLKVPAPEAEPVKVAEHVTRFEVVR